MSALSFRNVWVEYGSQIVLERINIEITATMVPNDAPAIGSSPTVSPRPSPIRVEIPNPSNSRCRLAAVSVHST